MSAQAQTDTTFNTSVFDALSDDARLWIYALDTVVTADQAGQVQDRLNRFTAQWLSHGRKVQAAAALWHGRFLVIAAEIPDAEISGCGIDASVHAVEEIGATEGFSILPALSIFYRHTDGALSVTDRAGFRAHVRSGAITGNTIVLDPSITRLSEFRAGLFEQPARNTWHQMVFRIPEADPNAS